MPYFTNKTPAEDVKTMQDALFAANNGISKDFVDKNTDIVSKSNRAVNATLMSYGVGNTVSNSNSLRMLSSFVEQSMRFKKNRRIAMNDAHKLNGDIVEDTLDSITGIKQITPLGNIDNDERQIVDMSAQLYQSFMNVTAEYRGVCKIVPEIDKAIDNIVRDILSVSELSGRIFTKIYDDQGKLSVKNSKSKEQVGKITDILQKEIIDKNDLEKKAKRWVKESLVCGAKPIAFIPYDYILRQLGQLNDQDRNLQIDVGGISSKLKSGESFNLFSTEAQERRFIENSVESSFEDMIDKDFVGDKGLKADEAFDRLLDDELVDKFAAYCEEDFNRVYESIPILKDKYEDDNARHHQIYGTYSIESNQQLDLLSGIEKNYNEVKKRADELDHDEKVKHARAGLRQLARYIDDHIDVVKTGASSAYIAQKVLKRKDRYKSFYNLGENYLMAEGFKKKQEIVNSTKDPTKSGGGNQQEWDSQTELGKSCLIVPYAPESVVPINVSGEYMGFYCLEYENIVGPTWKNRRRSGSFTDYVLQQGIGNDSNFLGGNAPMVAYGGSDPLENNLYSPLALYNYSVNQYMYGGMDQQDQRFDIMKTVVLRVLAHRLRDPDLVENKTFKDAVMTMLRNDLLSRKKVQFTFLPPEYMCYMTYRTDDDGLPISILDGTLFFCYLYISSIVSSAMIKMLKSSDKEKYEVAVGLQKNSGYTIDELQRVLSTRTLYTSSMFSNLSSVIKNAGSYQRLIIPVINGQKLYDVTQIEHMQNLDPDDNYTSSLLESILSKIFTNSGMSQELDSVDFAKQLSMRNLEYRNNIVEAQHNYEPFFTKAIRLLTHYSTLDTYNSDAEVLSDKDFHENLTSNNKIDIARINVEFSIPTMISMTNIVDMIDTAKNVANGIAEVFNLSDGNETETARNNIFKRKIIEKYANIVEWSEIEMMIEEATKEAPTKVQESKKLAKIDETVVNTIDNDDTGDGGGGDSGGFGDDTGF